MSRPAVLAASLLCALPGGWLASLAWTLTTPVRVALVLTGALVGAAVAALAVTGPSPARPGPARPPESRANGPGRRPPAAGAPSDTALPRHRTADRAVSRHVASGSADPSPPDPHPAGPDDAGPVGPWPDGGDRAERAALIAQCPRCGELRLDSGRNGPAYRFRCGNPGCGHAWTWHPDEPWPPVVVRRNLPSRTDRKPG
ncbi:hypothetical protein GCM10023321_21700 [Pseudonocardia eucalypti]|uniref:Zinc finger Ogr/Delta-type domain-containing protein n=1 Tax=Pseudonocardia eucalypti TaxID=648755 RepID=A0ABP9Q1T2_9PSEU|nr:hypothetical protein [Pseudonocardia eucalypti]